MTEKGIKLAWTAYGGYDRERITFRATICDLSYSLDQVPNGAFEFAAWFNAMLSKIPEEYRASAILKLHNDDCYECSSERAKFELTIERGETDAEYSERMAKMDAKNAVEAKRKAADKERRDRADYERLKAKFG